MSLYKFGPNDIFHNRVKTHPRSSFFIYDAVIYYNNQVSDSGSFTSTAKNVSSGFVSLYEINVDRDSSTNPLIYPFVTKDGARDGFRTISTTSFNNSFGFGDQITSSYPLSASITRDYFSVGATRTRIKALQNTLNYYTPLSDHYAYSSSLGLKASQSLGLISVPSIFYGSSIRKGSVSLKFYITGTLVGELQDKNKNGELIQVSGSDYAQGQGSGSVAGVVLYNEGFLVLTGSWPLETTARDYVNSTNVTSSWQYFGAGANDGVNPRADATLCSASFDLSFEGVNYVSTITMFAHADKAALNYSNNTTFVKYTQPSASVRPITGSTYYIESNEIEIKNTMTSSYSDTSASFQKQTFISKIGIYDEDKNLIAIASLATPVKKHEDRDLTFKLKYDI